MYKRCFIFLVQVEKESIKKEERLQEKDSVIKTLNGHNGSSVALAKKIHKQKTRLKLQVNQSFLEISILTRLKMIYVSG